MRQGAGLQEKLAKTLWELHDYYDPEDPQYITLAEAFAFRFKQHKFRPENMAQYNEENTAMDEIYKKSGNCGERTTRFWHGTTATENSSASTNASPKKMHGGRSNICTRLFQR